MNDPLGHPLVRAFLVSVEQHAAALPADRREELLTDLREDIEAALAADGGTGDAGQGDGAENGGADGDERVRQALAWLGTPRAIAEDALAEESGRIPPEPENPGGTRLTLGLAVLPVPLCLVPGIGIPLGLAAAVGALVRLWRSTPWVRREKWQATGFILAPVAAVPALAFLFSLVFGGLGTPAIVAALLLALCLPVTGAVRLARSAARLRERAVGSAPELGGAPLRP